MEDDEKWLGAIIILRHKKAFRLITRADLAGGGCR